MMSEKVAKKDSAPKKGRNGDASSKSGSRIWGEARKEIIPLSIGAIALVASSSVNQGTSNRSRNRVVKIFSWKVLNNIGLHSFIIRFVKHII